MDKVIYIHPGFPKTATPNLNQNISYFIEYSDFCNFESSIYEYKYNIEKVDCFDKKSTTDLLNPANKFCYDKLFALLYNIFQHMKTTNIIIYFINIIFYTFIITN